MNEATASGFVRSSMAARSPNSTDFGQLELRGVLLEQRGIGVEHADDLHVGACLRGAQEAADVPVHEAGDGEPHRRRGRRLRQRR